VEAMQCVFSGSIELDALRLMQTMIQEVQCPWCGSVRKAKVKGQEVLMTPHKPRTMRAVRNVTAPDGAGNGAGTRSEIRSSKPLGLPPLLTLAGSPMDSQSKTGKA
jgi:hypothetical protein